MTFRQIGVGVTLGMALTLGADFGPLPEPLAVVGLVVTIAAFVLGGADGTLPRM